ncbi:glycine/betaine ABC transporter ATP-binding protein, partial [Streptomyces sp. SID8455]|nr:glycine/betaine ABC transporter ATP-binding protein [Streptomyces sp. SID8455]
VRPEATVSEAIEAVSRSGDPAARVMDGGRLVGVVDHVCLLDVVAGTAASPGSPVDTPDAPDGSREVTV